MNGFDPMLGHRNRLSLVDKGSPYYYSVPAHAMYTMSCTRCRCIVPAHYTHSVIQCRPRGGCGALPDVSLLHDALLVQHRVRVHEGDGAAEQDERRVLRLAQATGASSEAQWFQSTATAMSLFSMSKFGKNWVVLFKPGSSPGGRACTSSAAPYRVDPLGIRRLDRIDLGCIGFRGSET